MRHNPVKFVFRVLSTLLWVTLVMGCHKGVTLTDSQGVSLSIPQKERWVWIHYWAEWCPPCIQELSELEAFYKTHEAQVIVVGVNIEKWPDLEMRRFATTHRLTFPLFSEFPSEVFNLPSISTVPTTFILDPSGQWVHTLYGAQTKESLEKALAHVRALSFKRRIASS